MTDYYDLGTHQRAITTKSKDAQMWFDRGLIWCFGYNHDESVACFQKAVDADPDCAIAYWGIAYASGCNYNKPWEAFDEEDAMRSVARACAFPARLRRRFIPRSCCQTRSKANTVESFWQ